MRLFFINARECMNLLVIESTTHSCVEATVNVLCIVHVFTDQKCLQMMSV